MQLEIKFLSIVKSWKETKIFRLHIVKTYDLKPLQFKKIKHDLYDSSFSR